MKTQVSQLFKEEEGSVSRLLVDLSVLLGGKTNLLAGFERVLQYHDEPKPWQYTVSINSNCIKHDGNEFKTVTSGISFFSEKSAILKCLSEAVERYCNFAFFKQSVSFVGSHKDLKTNALDPMKILYFSDKQLSREEFKKFVIADKSIFSWSKGVSLISGQKIEVPSQMIYLSYPHLCDEPVIYPGISTGTAGGGSLSAAIVRGICEIIERDAFMIFYLNKLPATKIQLDLIDDRTIKSLLKTLKRYKMEVFSFDLTTDVPVPTYLSVVINRTGIGKAVSVGMKCSLDALGALVGSIEETFNTRTWLRKAYEESGGKKGSTKVNNPNAELRGFLWYQKDIIKQLDFLLLSPNSKTVINTHKIPKKSGEQLKYLIDIFRSVGYDVIYKDITMSHFKNMNYFVSKVIIPKMQPFFLNEDHGLLGGSRLYEVPEKLGFARRSEEELNDFPHPFI